jgi:CysZ protein
MESFQGIRGAFRAFFAPFGAIKTIATRPSLWPLAATPTLIFLTLLLFGGAGAGRVYDWASAHVAAWLGSSMAGAAGLVLAKILIVLVLIIAVIILASLIVPPLASPFMDKLAGRIDQREAIEEALVPSVLRSLRVALTGLVLVAIPQAVVWILSLALPIATPLWLFLGTSIAALGLSYDAFDWPLARRGLGVRDRLAWMRSHGALTLGLGAAVWLMFLVPGMSIVMLPATVLGGVKLVNDLERAGEVIQARTR